jgi:hypothetical protein
VGEELLRRALLDDPAGVHDEDAPAHAGDDAEVVGDDDDRGVVLVREALHEFEDLRLDRHVEGRRRLVGQQQLRVAGEGDRDHDALPHAARELVRVVLDALLGLGDADRLQQLNGACDGLVVRHPHVVLEAFGHESLDGEDRVQAGHGILEDHRDVAAAHAAHLALGQSQQVAPVELDGAGDARVRDHAREAHDRVRRHALAAARLADEPDELAAAHAEGDPVDGVHDAFSRCEVDDQVANVEHCRGPSHGADTTPAGVGMRDGCEQRSGMVRRANSRRSRFDPGPGGWYAYSMPPIPPPGQ